MFQLLGCKVRSEDWRQVSEGSEHWIKEFRLYYVSNKDFSKCLSSGGGMMKVMFSLMYVYT